MLPISEEHHIDNGSQQQQPVIINAAEDAAVSDDKASSLATDASLWTALYDYDAQGEDELTLRRGQVVVLLSTDSEVSGDVGWWTGKIGDKVRGESSYQLSQSLDLRGISHPLTELCLSLALGGRFSAQLCDRHGSHGTTP